MSQIIDEIMRLKKQAIPPVIYYGASEFVENGKSFCFYNDEIKAYVIILHPNQLDELREYFPHARSLIEAPVDAIETTENEQ